MAARVLYMHEGNARSLEDLSMGAVASYLKARFPETHVEAMERRNGSARLRLRV